MPASSKARITAWASSATAAAAPGTWFAITVVVPERRALMAE